MTRGSDTWWWNDDIEKAIKEVKDCFRRLHQDRSADNIEKYMVVKKTAKRAVSEASGRAYEDLYLHLNRKKGERNIYKMAKSQEKKRDINQVKCIKNEVNGESESSTFELDDSFDDTSRHFVR